MRNCLAGLFCCVFAATPVWAQAGFHQVDQARQQLKMSQIAISRQISSAAPELQKKVSEVPSITPIDVQKVPSPADPQQKIEVVSDAQRNRLIDAVKKFGGDAQNESSKYSRLALAFSISGAVFALLASILSFLSKNRVAGILSLVVIAVVSAPNIYPMPALADFYRSVATQAIALQTDCELKTPFTVDDYSSAESQYKLLILYMGSKRPGFGNTDVYVADLQKEIQTLRTAANVVSTAEVTGKTK